MGSRAGYQLVLALIGLTLLLLSIHRNAPTELGEDVSRRSLVGDAMIDGDWRKIWQSRPKGVHVINKELNSYDEFGEGKVASKAQVKANNELSSYASVLGSAPDLDQMRRSSMSKDFTSKRVDAEVHREVHDDPELQSYSNILSFTPLYGGNSKQEYPERRDGEWVKHPSKEELDSYNLFPTKSSSKHEKWQQDLQSYSILPASPGHKKWAHQPAKDELKSYDILNFPHEVTAADLAKGPTQAQGARQHRGRSAPESFGKQWDSLWNAATKAAWHAVKAATGVTGGQAEKQPVKVSRAFAKQKLGKLEQELQHVDHELEAAKHTSHAAAAKEIAPPPVVKKLLKVIGKVEEEREKDREKELGKREVQQHEMQDTHQEKDHMCKQCKAVWSPDALTCAEKECQEMLWSGKVGRQQVLLNDRIARVLQRCIGSPMRLEHGKLPYRVMMQGYIPPAQGEAALAHSWVHVSAASLQGVEGLGLLSGKTASLRMDDAELISADDMICDHRVGEKGQSLAEELAPLMKEQKAINSEAARLMLNIGAEQAKQREKPRAAVLQWRKTHGFTPYDTRAEREKEEEEKEAERKMAQEEKEEEEEKQSAEQKMMQEARVMAKEKRAAEERTILNLEHEKRQLQALVQSRIAHKHALAVQNAKDKLAADAQNLEQARDGLEAALSHKMASKAAVIQTEAKLEMERDQEQENRDASRVMDRGETKWEKQKEALKSTQDALTRTLKEKEKLLDTMEASPFSRRVSDITRATQRAKGYLNRQLEAAEQELSVLQKKQGREAAVSARVAREVRAQQRLQLEKLKAQRLLRQHALLRATLRKLNGEERQEGIVSTSARDVAATQQLAQDDSNGWESLSVSTPAHKHVDDVEGELFNQDLDALGRISKKQESKTYDSYLKREIRKSGEVLQRYRDAQHFAARKIDGELGTGDDVFADDDEESRHKRDADAVKAALQAAHDDIRKMHLTFPKPPPTRAQLYAAAEARRMRQKAREEWDRKEGFIPGIGHVEHHHSGDTSTSWLSGIFEHHRVPLAKAKDSMAGEGLVHVQPQASRQPSAWNVVSQDSKGALSEFTRLGDAVAGTVGSALGQLTEDRRSHATS